MKNTETSERSGSGDGLPAYDDASEEVKTKRRKVRIGYLVLFLIIGLMPVVKGCNGVVTVSSVDVMILNVPQSAVESDRFAPYFILTFLALWTSAVMLTLALRQREVTRPESKFLWIGGAALGLYLIVTMVFASSYGRMITIEFGWFMMLLLAVLFLFHPKLEPLILKKMLPKTDPAGGGTAMSHEKVSVTQRSPVTQGGGAPQQVNSTPRKEGAAQLEMDETSEPKVSDDPSSAEGTEQFEPVPQAAASAAAGHSGAEASRSITTASATTDHAASARGGSRKLLIGAVAFVVLVVLVLFFALQGADKTDALVGHFTYETSGASSTLDISRNDAGVFFIEGESLYGTNREYGPNIGTLAITAELKEGVLVGTDDPDYTITIRPTDDGIIVEETGSNENFGFNVGFAGAYKKADDSAGDDEAVTSKESDALVPDQMDDDDDEGTGLSAAERNSIEDFVYSFIRAQNQNDIDALMAFYADEVDYYSWGTVPRNRIREDKQAYFKRWPVRNYTVQSGEITITPTDMAGVYAVTYGLDYAVESPERGKQSSGLVTASLTLQTKSWDGDPDSDLHITKERSQ